jgi:hypothetical protein
VDAVDRASFFTAEHDHRRMLDPAVDDVEVADEDEVEGSSGTHHFEPVARQVPLEEAAGLRFGIGNEERSGRHAVDGRGGAAARLVVHSHDCAPIDPDVARRALLA